MKVETVIHEFNHPPGVSYCPECHVVREYTSVDPSRCARFGTWASHCYSMLRHGPNNFQDYCCQCLTRYDCKSKFGSVAPYSSYPFEKESCNQCKLRNESWIWIGYTTNDNSTMWRKIIPESASFYLEGSGDAGSLLDVPHISGLEFPTHIPHLPSWVFSFSDLVSLNLKCCVHLQHLPLEELMDRLPLRHLNCAGCSQLWSPPQEVCNQGGDITVRFLHEVKARGEFSSEMTLLLIGDGEAGKTSVVLALKSENNKAPYIRSDYRTVGIDVSFWKPTAQKMEYVIYDLAGQGVYAKTHQLFILRRAVYLFVWKAGAFLDETLRTTIEFWLDSLQNRMPGSFVIMVVTHIDLVEESLLDSQCDYVRHTICEWITAMKSTLREGTPILRCWDGGRSLKVNCLSGEGVTDLRKTLISYTVSMPWYKECLPPSWIKLHRELGLLRKSENSTVPHITWNEFSRLAKVCDVSSDLLNAATKFLHDTGVIRYFGDLFGTKKKSDPLESTVYISINWMMNVMKGLIRHDRQTLLDFFWEEGNREMLRHTNRFSICGMLHKDLIPFLWPSQQQSEKFWKFVRKIGARESEIWAEDIVSSADEGERAIALLKGLDLVAESGNEFFVPSTLTPSKLPCTPVIDIPPLPHRICFKYNALPPGAFDTIAVRVVKKNTKILNFTSAFATLCNENGHIAQIFFIRSEDGKGEILVLRSSSGSQLQLIENEIIRMEGFFAGLLRLDRTKYQIGTCQRIKSYFSIPSTRAGRKARVSPSVALINSVCSEKQTVDACIFNREAALAEWNKYLAACNGSVEIAEKKLIPCTNCSKPHSLIDVLTNFRIQENRPCPNAHNHILSTRSGEGHGCMGAFRYLVCPCSKARPVSDQIIVQPTFTHTFNAGECRLHSSLDDDSRESTVICYSCLSVGLVGLINVSEIVPPELFVSGFMNLDERNQQLIRNLIKKIELEADVSCNNLSKAGVLEIKEAMFFVALLSDAYIVSNDCRKQIQCAMSGCKHIIPILLPWCEKKPGNGVSFGWSGSRDSDYWKHAVNSNRNASQDFPVDWSFLKNFKAFEMQILNPTDSFDLVCNSHDLDFVSKVARKIKIHLQRPGRVDLYSDFSILGIRLSYLDAFVARFGGYDAFLGLTTTQVMEAFIKPTTSESKLSFCELLVTEGHGEYVGVSHWFLSHAWNYFFLDVLDASKEFFLKQQSDRDPLIWFDIFSVSQHKAASRPFEWWNSAFLNAVGSIGKVLMVMQPFENAESKTPAWVTLSRVWCVFEIYACESTLSEFHVTMSKEMAARFLQSVKIFDMDLLLSVVNIDCEKSTAFKPEDKEQVFDVIQRSVGFPLLNSIVMRVIERWLYSELFSQIMEFGCCEKSLSYLQSMKTLSDHLVNHRIKTLGKEHPDTVQAETVLSHISKAQEDEEHLRFLISDSGKVFKRESGVEKTLFKDKSHEDGFWEITSQQPLFDI
jgi:hypothetical protein